MQIILSDNWHLSSLTDPSLPQGNLTLPNAICSALPSSVSQQQIEQQEWYLSHDCYLEEDLLKCPAIDLVVEGIERFAEVRVNGIAVFDCDGAQQVYQREIRSLLNSGKNRIELLLIEPDADYLGDEDLAITANNKQEHSKSAISHAPRLQGISNVRLEKVETEQVWHYGGGCELIVNVFYSTVSPGLVSASVKFDGMTYQLPLDVRDNHVKAIFQVEAPIYSDLENQNPKDLYDLVVELDGQICSQVIALSDSLCVSHSNTI
ncbi:glycosyl hydrolase 2 galactose-binding domain-containing protein [Vibrio marisflavi]|uniref:Beta-mannosidase-like galactose-binding domain-containing protein n=1 Tax=Vibrio marisflavi CECT 7928 TaxID=634439 RepID=A0ABN8E705_9VIBR|nr:hypothetical protein [Vibrio marisflavi]CAH0541560.1 hypothetical protein VMF7928_03623 [Vibrio marisflavi CECT 7928]